MNAYSDLKAGWHLGRIAKMRSGDQIVPAHIQLIISDLCNQDCHFCAYRSSTGFTSENFGVVRSDGSVNHNPNRMIPVEKVIEILDDASELGVLGIQFTGGGEPTVHPHHMDIFRHTLDRKMKAALVSNGVVLRDGWKSILPRFSWIRISLDAGTAGNYAKVRHTSQAAFAKSIAHISALASEIESCKSDCLLGVGFVVTQENYKEIVQASRIAKDTGAAYIRISAVFSKMFVSPYLGIYESIKESIHRAKTELEGDGFSIVDLFGDRIDDLEQGAPTYEFCGYQQFNTYIGGDLKVYRCCTTSYTNRGEVGDLSNMRLKDWIQSEEKIRLYNDFDARGCSVCQYNGKNKVINYLIDKKPTHVEFV